MHFNVKSLKNKHTKMINKVRVLDSRLGWWWWWWWWCVCGGGGGGAWGPGEGSTGDFGIDLYAKI